MIFCSFPKNMYFYIELIPQSDVIGKLCNAQLEFVTTDKI